MKLTIRRPKEMTGKLASLDVYINGSVCGQIPPSDQVELSVPDGNAEVFVKTSWCESNRIVVNSDTRDSRLTQRAGYSARHSILCSAQRARISWNENSEMMPPQAYFDRLPSEFLRDWLPARVENLQWPPTVRYQSWTGVLGDTPERWRLYRWREESLDLNQAGWRADTLATIQGLTDACFRGARNSWARFVSQSLGKIQRLQAYAMTHHALPSRLLVAETPTGRFLVDGYHRVSWFTFTSQLLGTAFPVSPIANCYVGRFEEA